MRPVNLIPGEQRVGPSGARSGSAYVVVGVLAVLLAMVAGHVITSNQVNERKTDAAEARAEADRLEARAQSLGPFASFTQIKQTRVSSVTQVATSRFDWERVMRELSRVIPADSWLQLVDAGVSGAPGDSSTSSQSGETGGPPAAQLVGCTPKQSEVAKMMVRLRELHRVTDVALNESIKEESEGTGGVDDCGRLYKFDVTVTFGAVPQGEAPRGANRVPATLGGGS